MLERTSNMRQLILAAASVPALLAGSGIAAAQVAIETPRGGVYLGPTYHYDYGYYEPYGPPVYGYYDPYYSGRSVRARERFTDRERCGYNAHWDGQQCVAGSRP
jgi:hypothetical protein